MTEPLKYHYAFFEQFAQLKRRKNVLGLSLGNGWYARKADDYSWVMGVYGNKYGHDPSKPFGYARLPKEQWVFIPLYTFTPGLIQWDPRRGQNKHLRAWSTSQRNKTVPSPVHKMFHPYNPEVTIQGEGTIVLRHDLQGYPLDVSTSTLPIKKTWDKEKYLALRRRRVKAERILRGMCKMGAFETEKVEYHKAEHLTGNYQELLQQLVDDKNPNGKTMEMLARMVQGRIRQMTHYRYDYTLQKSEEIVPTPDQAFAALRDKLREQSYKLTKTYTYEPFDDGRHTARFDP